jgi:LPS sulfotransferase NodH
MKVRLLLSTQRSGSHFLKSFVESRFPSVICSGEVLEEPVAFARQLPALSSHPEFPHFWLWYASEAAARSISVAPDRRIEAFELYLTKLTALASPKDVVVDAKYNSIRSLSGYWDTDHGSNDFVSFITGHQIPVLHLIRKNILRVIISHKLAQQTGIWHRSKERPQDELLPKIRLNPGNVLSYIQYAHELTQNYQGLFSGCPNYEEIAYEDLVRERDYPHTGPNLRTVAHFLGKKAAASNQATLPFKTTPEDPSEVVENWDEVHRTLRGTEYGWMVQAPFLAAA